MTKGNGGLELDEPIPLKNEAKAKDKEGVKSHYFITFIFCRKLIPCPFGFQRTFTSLKRSDSQSVAASQRLEHF